MANIFFEDANGKLIHGDVREGLKLVEDYSIDMIVTSPPYWALRDYHTSEWSGGSTDCDHVKDYSRTKVMGNPEFNKNRPSREATKMPGYYFSGVCEKCGATQVDGQLGQEPTFQEYITNLADIFDLTWDKLKEGGSLWVNLGDTFYGSNKGSGGKTEKQITNSGSYFNKGNKETNIENAKEFKNKELPRKSLCLIPSRFAIEMQSRGWILRNNIIWHKPNKFPESAKDRFTHDYEHLFWFVKESKGYYFEQQLEPAKESSKKRYKTGWNGAVDTGVAWSGNSTYLGSEKAMAQIEKGRNMRSVWSIITESKKGLGHFATYPRRLIESPIRSTCPVGGVVLDPFFGAGTTGIVAEKQDKNWIGIELNLDYCEKAVNRLIGERNDNGI